MKLTWEPCAVFIGEWNLHRDGKRVATFWVLPRDGQWECVAGDEQTERAAFLNIKEAQRYCEAIYLLDM